MNRIAIPGLPPLSEEGQRLMAERAAERERLDARDEASRIARWLESMVACIPSMCQAPAEELFARVKSQQAVAATRRAQGGSGIVWVGPSGSGKTTLACAAMRETAERVAKCSQKGDRRPTHMFLRAAELAVASKQQALGEGTPEIVKRASSADLLVLDELGSEMRSPHWRDVEDVVFARYERAMPTWVTTWTTADDIAERYGEGFARRVFERATIIDCGG